MPHGAVSGGAGCDTLEFLRNGASGHGGDGAGDALAAHFALQGGAVDVIVSDWIWVTRQRAEGGLYSFAPYSNAVGSIMVKADSSVEGRPK